MYTMCMYMYSTFFLHVLYKYFFYMQYTSTCTCTVYTVHVHIQPLNIDLHTVQVHVQFLHFHTALYLLDNVFSLPAEQKEG